MPNTNNIPTQTDPHLGPLATETSAGGPSQAFSDTIADSTTATSPPELIPPEETAAAADAGITAWLSNKKIVGVWSNASNKNSWINIQGTGWRRIHSASENAVVAMTILASHARADDRTCSVRVESDNHVHEIYVW
jgi:D-arabinose 1-dehydrogenase-like Zn-dependent alcohol dehydrogenase